ncbi:hypothetical protein BAT_1428 [Bacillus pumilus ATCC 7061]|nr:hypothetical protein BAT_1428 [Bacillus pumilus ATCC 7061]
MREEARSGFGDCLLTANKKAMREQISHCFIIIIKRCKQ